MKILKLYLENSNRSFNVGINWPVLQVFLPNTLQESSLREKVKIVFFLFFFGGGETMTNLLVHLQISQVDGKFQDGWVG